MTNQVLGSIELNRIYQMDCLEGMRLIPDKSVDLIVIDPPYNIGKDKRWDKWKTVEDYVNWMTEVFKECERVLKDTGSFYWFHNDMTQTAKLIEVINAETSFVYKQFIIWNKRFEGARNKGFLDGFVEVGGLRNYQQMTEYCLFYTFQEDERSIRIGEITKYADLKEYFRTQRALCEDAGINIDEYVPYTSNFHYFANGASFNLPTKKNYEKLRLTGYFKKPLEELRLMYRDYQRKYTEEERYTFNHQATHHSVWNYETASKQGHVTPKPLDMIENIIRHSSNEGDIVLDCFMGSGTTAVAAARLNRNFIGFERETEYIEIANKRIDNELGAN